MGSGFNRTPSGRSGFSASTPAQSLQTGGMTDVFGQNSGIGKAIANDPIHRFIFGGPKYVMPTAGPWAGTGASLAAANSGYGLNASGNPALGGGGNSAQLQATFATKPASFSPAVPQNNVGQGYLNASRAVM